MVPAMHDTPNGEWELAGMRPMRCGRNYQFARQGTMELSMAISSMTAG